MIVKCCHFTEDYILIVLTNGFLYINELHYIFLSFQLNNSKANENQTSIAFKYMYIVLIPTKNFIFLSFKKSPTQKFIT